MLRAMVVAFAGKGLCAGTDSKDVFDALVKGRDKEHRIERDRAPTTNKLSGCRWSDRSAASTKGRRHSNAQIPISRHPVFLSSVQANDDGAIRLRHMSSAATAPLRAAP